MSLRSLTAALFLATALLALAAPAWPRAGGGESYDSGGSSGGGGGYSGGGSDSGGGGDYGGSGGSGSNSDGEALGALIRFFLELTFEYPRVMIPVWLTLAATVYAGRKMADRGPRGQEWTLGSGGLLGAAAAEPVEKPVRRRLEELRGVDPAFSIVVFEDFLYALYAKLHEARGDRALDRLAPYVSPTARRQLEEIAPAVRDVTTIVIGALRYLSVSGVGGGDRVVVRVELDSNYTEVEDAPRAYFARERWTLRRSAAARSRPPEKVSSFGCPACGAPQIEMRGDRCAYCGQAVRGGEADWIVDAVAVVERRERGPQLTGTVAERGTSDETVVDSDLQTRRTELGSKDPAFTVQAFEARVRLVFQELQAAWSARDLSPVRAFLSDNLYQTQQYWVDAYRQQRLRNVLETPELTKLALARVTSDLFYDAITIRLWASGLDYTLDEAGEVVAGSRTRPRAFSEYWTFIRGTGVRGTPRADRTCPQCGAELKINMAGACEHCGAALSSGRFDWVLSRIEQDEAYTG